MANSSIETSFQNLVNVIKEKTYPATSGAALEADIADIKIDITDLGISKIGISQIGMPGGVAPTSHTHAKSQITDFPESMPASDVHAWAKAANKPDYTPVEIGAIGISQVGMANGVASLGNDGKVPSSQLPAMTIPVTSVNNKTGDVVLTPSDIDALGISQVGMANGVAGLNSEGKLDFEDVAGLATVATTGSYNDLEDAPNWTSVADTEPKTWEGISAFTGEKIWSDGNDIYYSDNANQYVLDKATSTWSQKTWYGLTNFSGTNLWTDPDGDVYYSYNNTQYKLDKETSTWNPQTWYGIDPGTASYVWNDGENIYYSNNTTQYVLNKQTSTWTQKTWTGLTKFYGKYIWTDGTDIYYSNGTNQYVLDKATSTWSQKTWNGLSNFDGDRVWFDGDDIYYSYASSNKHYVFDKTNNTWVTKAWSNNIDGPNMWNCDDKTYYSNGGGSGTQFEIIHKDLSELVGKAGGLATLGSDGKVPTDQLPASMPASDVYAWAKASTKPTYTASEVGAIATTAKGAANGVASLDSNGKVPISQIPGTVDEIKEGYLNSTDGKFYEESTYTTEIPAASDKIYVDLSTNLEYRWGGSAYVEISKSIALGRTSSTAFPGDAGKAIEDCVPSGASSSNKFATTNDIPTITAQTTDPGAGSALITGNIILVYEA